MPQTDEAPAVAVAILRIDNFELHGCGLRAHRVLVFGWSVRLCTAARHARAVAARIPQGVVGPMGPSKGRLNVESTLGPSPHACTARAPQRARSAQVDESIPSDPISQNISVHSKYAHLTYRAFE